MALQVGELFAKLGLNDSEFKSKLSGAEKLMSSAGNAMQKPLGFMGNMLSTAGGFIAGGVISGLASQFGELTGAMVGGNAQFETYEASFATLMGSVDGAKAKIAELGTFAATTPFELPEVVQGAKNLLTFGGAALNTQENITLVGNAAAATGQKFNEVSFWVGRAYSMIQAGKPFGEAAMRLQEMGILSAGARAKLESLQETGASGAKVWAEFQGSITAPIDAMDKLGATFEGLKSTAVDNLGALGREAGAPLFAFAKQMLQAFNTDAVQNKLKTFASQVASTLGAVLSWISGTLIPNMTRAWATVAPALSAVMGAISNLMRMFQALGAAVFGYGTNVGVQFGNGIIKSVSYVANALGAIARVVTYWLQPHSPPKLLPDLDQWGKGAAQVYLDGWGSADDLSAIDEMGGTIKSLLQSFADIGQGDEAGIIPAVIGSREGIAQAIKDIEETGAVSEDTLRRLSDLGGEGSGYIVELVQSYAKLRAATEEVAAAQAELNGIQEEYNAKLAPLNKDLSENQKQQKAIKDKQRIEKLNADIADASKTEDEKQLARLEIQEIQMQQNIDAVEEEKDQHVEAAKAKVDAAQAKMDAAAAEYNAQKATISSTIEQNNLIKEQIALLERLAKEAEGAKGKGGGGGMPAMPELPALPGLPALPDPNAGKAEDDNMLAGLPAVDEGAAANAGLMDTLGISADGLKEKLTGLASVIGGIAAGFMAFSVISTVVGWVSGLSAAFAGSTTILGGLVAILGGPLTLIIAAVAVAIGLFAAAWIGNWGNIQGVMSGVVGVIAPLIEKLKTNFMLMISNIQPGWQALMQGLSAATPIFTAIAAIIGGVLVGALGALAGMLPGIGMIFSGVFAVIGGVIQAVASLIVGVVSIVSNLLQGDFAGAWQAAGAMVSGVVLGILQVVGGLMTAVIGVIGGLVAGVIGFFTTLYDVLVGHSIVPDMVAGIISVIESLPGAVLGVISSLVSSAIESFNQFKDKATTAFSETVSAVKGFIDDLKGAIGNAVNDIKEKALSVGKAIIDGIKKGLGDASALVEAAKNAAKAALQAAKDFLGIKSPSREAAKQIGEPFNAGIAQGIVNSMGLIKSTIRNLKSELLKELKDLADTASEMVAGSLRDALSGKAQIARDNVKLFDDLNKMIPKELLTPQVGFNDEETAKLEAERKRKLAEYQALQQGVRDQLAAAQAEAGDISNYDAELAAKFYKMKTDQIMEMADLQRELTEANSDEERAQLQQKIALVQQAQAAEAALFQNQAQDSANQYDSMVEQLEERANVLRKQIAQEEQFIAGTKGTRDRKDRERAAQMSQDLIAQKAALEQLNASLDAMSKTGAGGMLAKLQEILAGAFNGATQAGVTAAQVIKKEYHLHVNTTQTDAAVIREFGTLESWAGV